MTTPRPETPYHLVPLTEGTPLSLEKLKSAWPGLDFRDKIQLLAVLLGSRDSKEGAGVLKWKRHRNFLISVALADANEYIRYSAALHVSESDKDEESKVAYKQVTSDSSGLVKSTQDSSSFTFLFSDREKEIERFWRVSKPERLAVAAGMIDSQLTDCLKFALKELLPNGVVTSGELEDTVHEFLGSDGPKCRKAVRDLWQLVPEVPSGVFLSLVLVNCLPSVGTVEVPQEVLDRFDDDHMQVLLGRDDIQLLGLRRKVFSSTSKQGLMHAAVSNANFPILDSDISELFASPASAKDRAVALAQSAKGATLVQKRAMRWFAKQHNICGMWVEYYSEKHLASRSEGLSGKALEEEVLQMRLFEYARALTAASDEGIEAVRDSYSGDLKYLQKQIREPAKLAVTANPWETYLNLRQSVRSLSSLRDVLPGSDDEYFLDRTKLPADF